jgi:CRISPR-associated protein Cas6
MTLDLLFPVLGDSLATDHSYLLFAAASHLAPVFHDNDAGVRFGAITGTYAGGGRLKLHRSSRWRVRLPDERIRDVLTLAGKSVRVGDQQIRLGAPSVAALIPAPSLIARIVTFKASQPRDRAMSIDEPSRFLEVARKKLELLGVKGEPALPLITTGETRWRNTAADCPREGEEDRWVFAGR